MTRNKCVRLLVPFSLMGLMGCNTDALTGSTATQEVTVQSHADATKVVSVEDSLPKPPRYSPFLIDHKTISPFASQAPDDDATPTPKPSAAPSTSPAPSPSASVSPGASSSPSAPLDYGNGTFVATLVAGGGSPGTPKDGTGGAAVFATNGTSVGIAVNFEKSPPDNLGLTDSGANQLRKVAFANGQVGLIAGDAGNSASKDDASLKDPGGACFNALQKVFYIADSGHHRIASVNPTTNAISWIAGSPTLAGVPATPTSKDGKGSGVAADQLAVFNNPRGLAFKPSTTVLYIADTGAHCIRALDLSKTPSEVTTIAGTLGTSGKPAAVGTAEDALATKFNGPTALALSTDEKTLYVADTGNHCIRAIDVSAAAAGKVRVVAGTLSPDNKDGTGTGASFISPCALAADKTTLWVGEQGTPRIRVVDMATGRVTTALGLATAGKVEGDKTKAAFTKVTGLGALLDDSGKLSTLYAFDAGDTTNGPRVLSIKP